MGSEWDLEAVQCSSIMNHCLSVRLILYAQVITKALRETQNSSGNPLNCTTAVEDRSSGSNPRQRHCVAELSTQG